MAGYFRYFLLVFWAVFCGSLQAADLAVQISVTQSELEKGDQTRSIIENESSLEESLNQIANKRYQQIGTKIRRAVVRSIIYILWISICRPCSQTGWKNNFIIACV